MIDNLKETLDRELSSMGRLGHNPRLELVKDVLIFHNKCTDEQNHIMWGVKNLYIQQTNIFWGTAAKITNLALPALERALVFKHITSSRKIYLDFELAFALYHFHGHFVSFSKIPNYYALGNPVEQVQNLMGDGAYYKKLIQRFRPLNVLDTAYYSEDEV
jgi:hypothetical protein